MFKPFLAVKSLLILMITTVFLALSIDAFSQKGMPYFKYMFVFTTILFVIYPLGKAVYHTALGNNSQLFKRGVLMNAIVYSVMAYPLIMMALYFVSLWITPTSNVNPAPVALIAILAGVFLSVSLYENSCLED